MLSKYALALDQNCYAAEKTYARTDVSAFADNVNAKGVQVSHAFGHVTCVAVQRSALLSSNVTRMSLSSIRWLCPQIIHCLGERILLPLGQVFGNPRPIGVPKHSVDHQDTAVVHTESDSVVLDSGAVSASARVFETYWPRFKDGRLERRHLLELDLGNYAFCGLA